MVVSGQKKPKNTSSTIFGVEAAAKCCELKRCADQVRNRTDKAKLNFSPELFRLNWIFSPSTKKTTEYSFELFFSLTNLFLTVVVFACVVTTRVTMHLAPKTRDSAQGYIQCVPLHIDVPVVRSDFHVSITSLPKFPGLIGYQICLAMVLRWRASVRAPLKSSPLLLLQLLFLSCIRYRNNLFQFNE